MENAHAQQRAGTAAQKREQKECFFRDAPGLAPGTPLICAESRKSGDVDGQQIQCRQIVQDFQEAAFSFEGYAFFPSYEERNAKARSFFARCLVKSTKAGYNVSIF